MRVSVVLPNYNHGHWLPRALGALATQVLPTDEIIVIDDGSTDDSIAVVEDFQRRFPAIHLIRHEVNRGTGAAVRTGIAAATGDLLLFAAADDFILPGLFERARAALQAYPSAAFFCSDVAILNREGDVIGLRPITPPRSTSGYFSPADTRSALRSSDNWFVGTSIVYRRDRLSEVGYFDPALGSLADAMVTRLLALRYGFFFAAETLATWRIYPESLSSRSVLSNTESRRLRQIARQYITQHFPVDIARTYAQKFDRLLRFNTARLQIVWKGGLVDTDKVVAAIDAGTIDGVVLRSLGHLPFARTTILAWIAMRLRPYGIGPLLRSAWRSMVLHRTRRAALSILIASRTEGQIASPTNPGVTGAHSH